jgi:prepilin-type N-terminal cleavage/methylation domain-containing protein
MNRTDRTDKGSRSEAGFTLIEALIAIVILAFGLISVTNLFVVAASSNQIGNYTTATATEASEVLERLKSIDFCSLAPGGDLANDAGTANPAPVPPAQPDVFVGGALTYHMYRDVKGIGSVRTRWLIVDPAAAQTPTRFIVVQSEIDGPFGGQASRAQFSTFRTCTGNGCPLGSC